MLVGPNNRVLPAALSNLAPNQAYAVMQQVAPVLDMLNMPQVRIVRGALRLVRRTAVQWQVKWGFAGRVYWPAAMMRKEKVAFCAPEPTFLACMCSLAFVWLRFYQLARQCYGSMLTFHSNCPQSSVCL